MRGNTVHIANYAILKQECVSTLAHARTPQQDCRCYLSSKYSTSKVLNMTTGEPFDCCSGNGRVSHFHGLQECSRLCRQQERIMTGVLDDGRRSLGCFRGAVNDEQELVVLQSRFI